MSKNAGSNRVTTQKKTMAGRRKGGDKCYKKLRRPKEKPTKLRKGKKGMGKIVKERKKGTCKKKESRK
jgi:hypothetical protein